MTDIDKIMETARELDPELWGKVDTIAEIINPGAFVEYTIISGDDENIKRMELRQKYHQSVARSKAWQILQHLEMAPENYDWVQLFNTLKEKDEND